MIGKRIKSLMLQVMLKIMLLITLSCNENRSAIFMCTCLPLKGNGN